MLVNHRHHQPPSTVNLDPMWLNVLPDQIRMIRARISIGANLILCPLRSHRLAGYPVSVLLSLQLIYPLVMLKPLNE